nr:hypothetical protein [Tanacetum cinerariifolium]
MILIGQKNTLAEYMILSGADNHPPMLKKDMYDSWKSRMELYMQKNKSCQRSVGKVQLLMRELPRIYGKSSTTNAREKVLLVEAQGNGKVLNEEELEFLADPAKAVLMANLSSYESNVLSEVPISDNTNNDMLNQNFGKRFVPQRELSDEQALHPITDKSASSPVKIETPWELLN